METSMALFEAPIHQQCKVVGSLIDYKPDLLFTVNCSPGALMKDIGLCKDIVTAVRHPRLCYVVDNITLYDDVENLTSVMEDDWFFCADRTFLSWLTPQTNHAYHLPAATMFAKEGVCEERFAAPLSYVGSLPDLHQYLSKLSPVVFDLLVQLEKNAIQGSVKPLIRILQDFEPQPEWKEEILSAAGVFCSTTNKKLTAEEAVLEYFLYAVITYFKRKRIVEAFLPLGLKVYGPESWLEVLSGKYEDQYGGFVENYDLQNCYRSAEISLNIHSYQCPTCLNMRDFDVPMSGGLVLGDYVEDADRGLLTPGKDMLVYTEIEEAVELASLALADNSRLEEMRKRAHSTVQNQHTFYHRVRRILDILAKHYNW